MQAVVAMGTRSCRNTRYSERAIHENIQY